MAEGYLEVLLQDPDFSLLPILEKCNELLSQMSTGSVKIYATFLIRAAEKCNLLDVQSQSALLKCFLALLKYLPIPRIASLPIEHDEKAALNELLVKVDEYFKALFKTYCEGGVSIALDCTLPFLTDAPAEVLHFCWRNYVKLFSDKMDSHGRSVAAWCESIKECCQGNQNDLKLTIQASSCLTFLAHNCISAARKLPIELLSSLLTASAFIHNQLQTTAQPDFKERQARLVKELNLLVLERPELIQQLPAESALFWNLLREGRSFGELPQLKQCRRVGRLLCNNPALVNQIPGFRLGCTLFLEQALQAGIGWRQLLFLSSKAQVNDELLIRSQLLQSLKLSLLSRGLDELNEISKVEFAQGISSMSVCLLASVFPFSLVRLDGQLLEALITELCFSIKNSSKRAGCELFTEALANLVAECFDSLKAEKISLIVSVLTFVSSARALHKLIRPLLQLKDVSLLTVLDAACQKCSFIDICALLRSLSFCKTIRDPDRTSRQVLDKFDRLLPRALPLASNPLLNHLLLHSLYFFVKYTADVSCITRPFLDRHREGIAAYVNSSQASWSKGEFTVEAEDSIWAALGSCYYQEQRRAQVCFDVEGDSGALLKAALKRLQGRVEALIQSGDDSSIKRLTATIQRLNI